MVRFTTADIDLGLKRFGKQVNIQKYVIGARPTSCMWVGDGCMGVPSQPASPKDKAG